MSSRGISVVTFARRLSGIDQDGRISAAPIGPHEWRLALQLFFLFAVVYCLLVPYTCSNWPLTGDEPHYLAMAESIARDGDLDLANNVAHCAADPHVQMTATGEWRPSHMIGLPLLLALPYAAAGRVGAALAMAILSALTVALTFLLAWQVTRRRNTALLSALVLGATPPFTLYAARFYPEMPGAFLLALALVALYESQGRSWSYAVAGLSAAAMPWLVIRFAPLSVVVAAIALVRALASDRKGRNLVTSLLPCAISAGLYLAYNHYIYGSWSPLASYGVTDAGTASGMALAAKWVTSLLGWLLDQRGGLFVYAPVFVFSLGGLVHLLGRTDYPRFPIVMCLVIGILFGIVLPGYWVQWSPPTRYLVVVLPILALGIGHVACSARGRLVRVILVITTFATIAIGAIEFARPWLAYNVPFSESLLYSALPVLGPLKPTNCFLWSALARHTRTGATLVRSTRAVEAL